MSDTFAAESGSLDLRAAWLLTGIGILAMAAPVSVQESAVNDRPERLEQQLGELETENARLRSVLGKA